MLTIHHLQVSQSERLPWLCEELSIPYDLKLHKRSPILSGPDMYALHPLGAAPIIQDGDITLAETEACAEYIINVHGGGRLYPKPKDSNYATFLYWYHFSNGTLQPAVSRQMVIAAAGLPADHQLTTMYKQKLSKYFELLDEHVGKNTWLAGEEFTAADVMIIFTLTTMRTFAGGDLSEYKNVLEYVKRCTDRPAYKAAREKADPELMDMTGGAAPPHFRKWML